MYTTVLNFGVCVYLKIKKYVHSARMDITGSKDFRIVLKYVYFR